MTALAERLLAQWSALPQSSGWYAWLCNGRSVSDPHLTEATTVFGNFTALVALSGPKVGAVMYHYIGVHTCRAVSAEDVEVEKPEVIGDACNASVFDILSKAAGGAERKSGPSVLSDVELQINR